MGSCPHNMGGCLDIPKESSEQEQSFETKIKLIGGSMTKLWTKQEKSA